NLAVKAVNHVDDAFHQLSFAPRQGKWNLSSQDLRRPEPLVGLGIAECRENLGERTGDGGARLFLAFRLTKCVDSGRDPCEQFIGRQGEVPTFKNTMGNDPYQPACLTSVDGVSECGF